MPRTQATPEPMPTAHREPADQAGTQRRDHIAEYERDSCRYGEADRTH
jgi:hypothetical protein